MLFLYRSEPKGSPNLFSRGALGLAVAIYFRPFYYMGMERISAETGYPAERWHIRYVGKENAKAMNNANMCLEEYVEFLRENENIKDEKE